MTSSRAVSFGRRIAQLSAVHPEKTAIVFAPGSGEDRHVSWKGLDRGSNQVAHLLTNRGVNERSMVVIALPNSLEHYLTTIGAWKLGACVLPLTPALPARARAPVLEAAQATAVVGDWEGLTLEVIRPSDLMQSNELSAAPLPDRIPRPGKAIASGGSTGRPKVIVDPEPWVAVPGVIARSLGLAIGFRPGQVQLVAAPLYHNVPFLRSHYGLFEDHTLVVMERFDAAGAVELIERYGVNFGFLVPTMMARMIRLPGIRQRDFSSIEAIAHSAAPCPPWLKRAWIDLIGAERLYETFGASEMPGMTSIRGDEWLAHPGSVGRPCDADLRILDEQGKELTAGQVGEIFLRDRTTPGAPYEYRGGLPPKTTHEGFVSAGDLGWVDSEGFLFLADRRLDLIVSGGANVYAAEVEGVLTGHPAVEDAAVIGLPDKDWGRRVHAVIQPVDPASPPSIEELDAHCRQWLAPYKVPKSYEFVLQLPRNEAGKIQRSALVAERAARGSQKVDE